MRGIEWRGRGNESKEWERGVWIGASLSTFILEPEGTYEGLVVTTCMYMHTTCCYSRLYLYGVPYA